jgi:hypothetical protein
VNTFSAIAVSSLTNAKEGSGGHGNNEEVPVLTILLHPFKESHSLAFRNKETLFGIHVNRGDPKKDVQAIEFVKPLELFSFWKKPGTVASPLDQSNEKTDKEMD